MHVRIVADADIPGAGQAFRDLGPMRLLPGNRIDRVAVTDADVLLVRSVTRVDDALLEGSRLRFVGSATTGTDHMDTAALRRRGIAFAHAPGSNAESVVEWVIAALLAASARRGEELRGKTMGIVGCGNVGSRLARRLGAFGMYVLRNDPPLARPGSGFVPLRQLLENSDIVSLHVPLARSGPFQTEGLVGTAELMALRPGAWIVNTSRGRVTNEMALKRALRTGRTGAALLDVWATEPNPDPTLLDLSELATPHIAGHSHDGKMCGTVMLHGALVRHLSRNVSWDESELLGLADTEREPLPAPAAHLPETAWLDAFVRPMCDVRSLDTEFRGILGVEPCDRAAFFAALRAGCPRRRSFRLRHAPRIAVPLAFRPAVECGLRVTLTD